MGGVTDWDAFHRPRWMDNAPCKGQSELFFPGAGDNVLVRKAKAICQACPYNIECLEHALELPEALAGIWGGTTQRQRIRMHRLRDQIRNEP